jgi:hypothetical protein
MKRVLAVFFSLMSSAALAQVTDTANPSAAPAQASVNDDLSSSGCTPFGLTASGEVVFPIQCKEVIDRHRAAAVERKPVAVVEQPAAVEAKPAAVGEKAAAKPPKVATAHSQPANKPVGTVPSPKRPEPLQPTAISSNDCTHFRSYDRTSGTYRGFDRQIRPCRIGSR